MKRVIGFALCFVAIGLIIGLFLPTEFITVTVSVICLVIGYQMFY